MPGGATAENVHHQIPLIGVELNGGFNEVASGGNGEMAATFTTASWVIVVCYIVAITTIGSLFYRKHTSAPEYFLGGRRMSALPVAISLVAADLSAATYMGAPAWCYSRNMELFLVVGTYLLVAPVVIYLFIPFYSRFNFFTGYEYLERRFDLKTRLVGSILFLLMRASHIAFVFYARWIGLWVVAGLRLSNCILVMGIFTTVYTTLGGMKAVIWTDVLQFTILLSGMVTICWTSLAKIPGGVLTAYTVAKQAGRLHLFNFSSNPDELTSFWAVLFGGGVMVLSTLGTDQAYLQRYFTTKSMREGRRSVLFDALIAVPVSFFLYLLGAALYVFYHFYPNRLGTLPSVDALLPYFVLHEVGGAFAGLITASIFAASMAVMSAGINSLTTVSTLDLYRRLLRPGRGESHYVLVGKFGTVAWGAAATCGALYAGRLGPVANAYNIINSFIGGPMLGIFLLGMLTRRANSTPTLIGAGTGLVVASLFAWKSQISIFYYALIGVVVTIIVGYLLSLAQPSRDPAELGGLVYGLDLPKTWKGSPLSTGNETMKRCGVPPPQSLAENRCARSGRLLRAYRSGRGRAQ